VEHFKNTDPLGKVLSLKNYRLPPYCREYVWDRANVAELIGHLIRQFAQDYRVEHTINDVRRYGHYYIGCLVEHVDRDTQHWMLDDGQQRIATYLLLLIHLCHRLRGFGLDRAANIVEEYIRHDEFGDTAVYRLNVPHYCKVFEEALAMPQRIPIKGRLYKTIAERNLVLRYNEIGKIVSSGITDNGLSAAEADMLVPLVGWITKNVVVSVITAPSEEAGAFLYDKVNGSGRRPSRPRAESSKTTA